MLAREPKKNDMANKLRGFRKIARHIAKSRGVSVERASAMLAAGTRRASASARRKNPRLNMVKGMPKLKRKKRAR